MIDADRSLFKNFGSAYRTKHIPLQWANLRPIKTRWMFFSVLSVVWTLVQHAVAAEPRTLGLEQLIQMALERSPELKMAEQDIAAPLRYVNRGTGAKVRLDICTLPSHSGSSRSLYCDPGEYFYADGGGAAG